MAEHQCDHCLGYGTKDEVTLESIKAHMEKVSGGDWSVQYDQADLEYCTNPPYPYAINGPLNEPLSRSTMANDGYKSQYGNQITEIDSMTFADAELFAHAPEYIRFLLAKIEELSS